jgi:hypothetical protein
MRRAAADLGDGFLMRAAALSQNGPRTSRPCPHPVHVGPEVHEVGKITLDRLLIGTQPPVQASELVRGQPSWRSPGWWRVRRRRGRVGDLGVVAASKSAHAEKLRVVLASARCRRRRVLEWCAPEKGPLRMRLC